MPGREWADWSAELRIAGEELKWKFTSDGSVNGWGWRFTVFPIMPAAAPKDLLSDRAVLARPSIDLVTCLLDFRLESSTDRKIMPRLAAALAACAQLGSLGMDLLLLFIYLAISHKNTIYKNTRKKIILGTF